MAVTTTPNLPAAVISVLDEKTSDDGRLGLRLGATMKFYALGLSAGGSLPATVGNGRVELLSRLTKFGGSRFGQFPGGGEQALRRAILA